MRDSKKGISAVVATVLIILITIAAIAIIWTAIIPMINKNIDFDDPDARLTIAEFSGYTFCDPSSSIVSAQVKRGSDDSDMTNLAFKVSVEGNSVSYSYNSEGAKWVVPDPNSAEVYRMNLSEYISGDCSLIDEISVAPITSKGEMGSISSSTDDIAEATASQEYDDAANDDSVVEEEPAVEEEEEEETGLDTTSTICFGDANSDSIYEICTCDDLQAIGSDSTNLSRDYILNYDINFSECDASYTSGEGFVPIGDSSTKFTGTFDGNGKTITGLYIIRSSDYQGFFGYVYGATIENLGLVNNSVMGSNSVGGLVGYAGLGTTITSCYSTGTVRGGSGFDGGSIGGLVGKAADNILISSSYATGDVMGVSHVGGLVGDSNVVTIINSYATGDVSNSPDSTFIGGYAGGLVGNGYGTTINSSYATGNVSNNFGGVGGLVGHFSGTITSSYAYWTDAPIGTGYVGGLVGENSGITINNENEVCEDEGLSGVSHIGEYTCDNGDASAITDITAIQTSSTIPANAWSSSVWSGLGGAEPTLIGVGGQ